MKYRWRTLAILALAVSGLAASCSSTTTDATAPPITVGPRAGGAVTFGLEADPNGLDPTRNAFDAVGKQVSSSIFDTWMTVGADGSAVPNLATGLDHSPDFKSWVIHIRPGVTFHDGSKLDAAAAVRSFQATHDSVVTGTVFRTVTGIVAVDDLTVRLEMSEPWAQFPNVLYAQLGVPVATRQLDDPDGQSHPIGTGPFKLETWNNGKSIHLVRNANYWRKDQAGVQLPYLDGVTYQIIPDGATRIAQLRSGDLDLIQARSIVDTQALDAIAKDPSVTVTHDPGNTETAFIVLNTAKAPLDDVRVRQAVAHATDVKKLAADNGWSADKLVDGPFGRNSPWRTDVAFPRFDPDAAKALISDYTRTTGKAVTIELTSPFDTKVVQEIAEQWAAVGIQTTVRLVDARVATLNAVFGQYDALFFSYFAAVDPDENYYFFTSKTVGPVNAFSVNFSRLTDPAMDQALDAQHQTTDVAARKQAFATVQQRFADLVPFVWLYQLDWVVATGAKVKQAKNVTTPDGTPAMPYLDGVFGLTETYLAA